MIRKRRRFRYGFPILWTLLVVLAGLLVNVYLALRPATLEARVRAELNRVLQVPFQFSQLQWSWSRGVELQGFRLLRSESKVADESTASAEDLLRVRSLCVRPAFLSMLRGRFEIDSVVLDAPFVRIARELDGRWNFRALFGEQAPSDLTGLTQWLRRLPTVLIRDGCIRYLDRRGSFSCTVDDVQAGLEHRSDGSTIFRAEVRGDSGIVDVRGEGVPGDPDPVLRWSLTARRADLSKLVDVLPADVAGTVRSWSAEGFLDFSGDFKWEPGSGLELLGMHGKLSRGRIWPPCMPGPAKELHARFRGGESSVEIEEVGGNVGGGTLRATARMESQVPWLELERPLEQIHWGLDLSLDSLSVDPSLRDFLPHALTEVYDAFLPGGRFGVGLRIAKAHGFPPKPEDVSATVRLEGVDLVHHKFPYCLRNLRGEAALENGRLIFKRPLQGQDGQARFTISGAGAELKPGGELDIVIKASSVVFDEKFRRALPGDVLRIWDDFRVAGRADAVIHLTRTRSDAVGEDSRTQDRSSGEADDGYRKVRVQVLANPRDLRISYRRFPYEITGITGNFLLDLEKKNVSLTDLMGRHGDQVIAGNAVVSFGDDRMLSILLHSDDLMADEDMLAALPEDARLIVRDFGFKGRFETDVTISRVGDAQTSVLTELELLEGTIQHRSFPYLLQLTQGHLSVAGGRAIEWTGVSTQQGTRPYAVCGGMLTAAEGRRQFSFDVDIAGLQFDDGFQSALPRELQSLVGNMNFGGTYSGHLKGAYEFDEADPTDYSVEYKVTDLNVEDGSLDFGLGLREMKASGNFRGSKTHGQPTTLSGNVRVDSSWFNRIHLTKTNVEFALGEMLHGLRSLVGEKKQVEGRDYSPPEALLERLRPEMAKDTFQMLIESDDIYGGTVDGLLYVGIGDSNDIGGDFVGTGLQVSRSVEDIFGSQGARSSGSAEGRIAFRGKAGDYRSLKGEGEGSIKDARLAEVPLFLGILNLLFGDDSSGQYFSEVLLKFSIADGKFVARSDGVEIKSSAVKLLGGGTLDFSGNLDLGLEPKILNFEIPLVEQILTLLKKGLAQVWITGNLSDPAVQFVTGAGMVRIDIGSGKEEKVEPLPSDLRKEPESDKSPVPEEDPAEEKDPPAKERG